MNEMQNFQPYKNGYRYRTGETGEVVDVEVVYELGGTNLFTNKEKKRGIYVDVTPRKVEGDFVVTSAFTGGRFFVEPLARASPKRLKDVAERLDAAAPRIAEAWLSDDTARGERSWEKPEAGQRVWQILHEALPSLGA